MSRRVDPPRPRNYTVEKKRVQTSTSSRNPAQRDIDWYTKPEAELYEHVFGRVRMLKNSQVTRRFELYMYQQAYTSRFGPALMGSLFSPSSRNPSLGTYAVSANVIKSCTDSACARISKSKPRAFCLPKKGDYRLKRKAKSLTKFLDGVMVSSDFYAHTEEQFRDACVYGDGQIVIYAEDGQIKSEVIKVDEGWVDAVDGMKDAPTEYHWTKAVRRTELLASYPDKAKQIEEARGAWRGEMAFMGQADMVEVTRSWRTPSKTGGDDGRWAISICTATLEAGEWKRDYLPVLRFHWTEPTYGPFGDGIAKELFGMQRAISDTLRGVLKSVKLFAVPRVWVDKQSAVNSKTISSEISVNEYSGNKPIFDTPPAASADIYQLIQWMIDWCFKQLGLSQLTAQSEKPAGLNAGVAMRTYQDIETQRFAIVGQRWERMFMQAARMFIDTAEEVYADVGKLSVKVPGRGYIETMDWGDVSLDKDLYDIGVWPTSILPETPEGKRQEAQEWVNSGFMPRDVALTQMRMPILNDFIDQETAARDNIEMCLDSILTKGKYIAPTALSNLALAIQLAESEWNRAQYDEVEPHKCDLLLRFLNEATAKKKMADAQQQAMQTPSGQSGGPGGAPSAAVGQAPPPPPAPFAAQGSGAVSAAA